MENKKTAVIYARQSYGKEESALSVEQQIERCKSWCERNNVEVIAIFKDNNTSSELYPNSEKGRAYCATDIGWQRWRKTRQFTNRKAYRQGLADAFDVIEKGKVDYFVVDENTRFYRNPSATSQLDIFCIVTLQESKTALVNVTENKIDHLESNINIAMWRAFAQYEMEKVNEKAATSIANRKANIEKGYVFSNAYGIDWINKKISYNAEKMEVVKYIFDSIIKGKTYAEILFNLNTKFLHLANGKCFYETSIYNIVFNAVYSGFKLLKDGRYIEIRNLANQAPIGFTTYLKAIQIVKDKKLNSGKQKYNIKDESKNFLPFSGLLRCGHCNSKLHSGKDRGSIIYFCKKTILLKDKECTPSRIKFDWCFDGLSDQTDFHLVFQPLFLIYLYQKQNELEQLKNKNSEINNLSADIQNLESKIKTITETFLSNGLDADIFKTSIESAKKDLVDKKNKLIQLKTLDSENSEKELEELRRLVRIIQDSESELDNDNYSRLLRDTIKEIIIYKEYIKVVLIDGNSFDLPRLKANRRAKRLPFGTSHTYIQDGIQKHVITYVQDEHSHKTKTLLKTDTYEIRMVY